MTLEQFWRKQHQTMPSAKGKNKLRQPTDNTATELAQHGSEHEEDGEETELEPGLTKALDLMTTKLMVAINDKLNPLAKTVLSHTRGLMTIWMKQRLGCYSLKQLTSRRLIE